MNLYHTIADLRAEHAKIVAAIAQLESLNGTGSEPRSPRGRKSMGEAERREVSSRMKRYWASRRKTKGAAGL